MSGRNRGPEFKGRARKRENKSQDRDRNTGDKVRTPSLNGWQDGRTVMDKRRALSLVAPRGPALGMILSVPATEGPASLKL